MKIKSTDSVRGSDPPTAAGNGLREPPRSRPGTYRCKLVLPAEGNFLPHSTAEMWPAGGEGYRCCYGARQRELNLGAVEDYRIGRRACKYEALRLIMQKSVGSNLVHGLDGDTMTRKDSYRTVLAEEIPREEESVHAKNEGSIAMMRQKIVATTPSFLSSTSKAVSTRIRLPQFAASAFGENTIGDRRDE